MATKHPVITVDGPSGSGKGTLCQLLAKELGWNLLDSGVLYRALAMAAEKHGVQLDNEPTLQLLARHLDVQFKATTIGEPCRVFLEGQEVSDEIRTEQWGKAASKVATLPQVREAFLERQRAFLDGNGLVADGRDMGSVVFPEAEFKVFLVASKESRAQRRYNQLKEKGIKVDECAILQDICERDQRDKQRTIAPLVPAVDAFCLDTTNMTIDQVFQTVLNEANKRLL